MGNRFIWSRSIRECYSERRISLRLNERDYEPHKMRPYGYESQKFEYRQIFEEAQSNQSKRVNRLAKKVARREAQKRLHLENENGGVL